MTEEQVRDAVNNYIENGGKVKDCGQDPNEFGLYRLLFETTVYSEKYIFRHIDSEAFNFNNEEEGI